MKRHLSTYRCWYCHKEQLASNVVELSRFEHRYVCMDCFGKGKDHQDEEVKQ